MKETAQQLITQLRELVSSIQQGTTRQDIKDKRKQLQAVNKSIQQLERQSVAVPDDLRNLKTSLAAELGGVDHAEDTLRFIDRELNGILDRIGLSVRNRKPSITGRTHGPRSREPITPVKVLRKLTIKTLKAHGGKGKVREVVSWVGEELRGKLTTRDKEYRSDGTVIWKNNVHWERQRMVYDGILKNNSPRGIWELSEDYL